MKFNCNRQKLNDAVLNVIRAVSSKSTMPALEGILIKAHNGKLQLSGYDLEIGITTSIDAMPVLRHHPQNARGTGCH